LAIRYIISLQAEDGSGVVPLLTDDNNAHGETSQNWGCIFTPGSTRKPTHPLILLHQNELPYYKPPAHPTAPLKISEILLPTH